MPLDRGEVAPPDHALRARARSARRFARPASRPHRSPRRSRAPCRRRESREEKCLGALRAGRPAAGSRQARAVARSPRDNPGSYVPRNRAGALPFRSSRRLRAGASRSPHGRESTLPAQSSIEAGRLPCDSPARRRAQPEPNTDSSVVRRSFAELGRAPGERPSHAFCRADCSRRKSSATRTRQHRPRSRDRRDRPGLLLPPALELRLPASAAPSLALRPRRHARLLCRGARLRRRGRAPAREPFRRGRRHGRGAAPAARARCRGPGRGAARAGRPAVPRAGHRAPGALVLHADGARLLGPPRGRRAVVYDCMDELSAFAGAPPDLLELERELFRRAPTSCSPAARASTRPSARQHANVHAFPSSVDVAHFAQAREPLPEPADQAAIPHPRIGYYGGDRRAAGRRPGGRASPTPARTGSSCWSGRW